MNGNSIITVSQLNFYTKSLLDGDPVLSQVFVRGEISNLTNHYRSGHIYFSLKDEKAVVRCVMFAGDAAKLRFEPQEGMSVIAIGRVSIYDATGQYQLYVRQMQPDGIGELTVAFNQLKEKLEKQGLFSPEYKKEIPVYPQKIGVVTSQTGAVRRDIETVLNRRYPLAEMVLYPAAVQGEQAVPELVAGIEYFNKTNSVDVIIIGRGGGSMEDLWAFNSELLAHTVYNSNIPVISAVGHATDVTICDFVADKTAPTPSAAAEIAVPDKIKLLNMISSFNDRIISAARYAVYLQQQRVDSVYNRLSVFSESYRLPKIKANLDNINIRLAAAFKENLQSKAEQLKECSARLNALSPLNILARGYSLALVNDEIVSSVDDVNINDSITVKLKNGELYCNVNDKRNDYNAKEENL